MWNYANYFRKILILLLLDSVFLRIFTTYSLHHILSGKISNDGDNMN